MASRFSEVKSAIPSRAGVGLRAPHYHDVLERLPRIGWFEVHSENYFGAGGRPLHYLERIRAQERIGRQLGVGERHLTLLSVAGLIRLVRPVQARASV